MFDVLPPLEWRDHAPADIWLLSADILRDAHNTRHVLPPPPTIHRNAP